MSTPALSVLRGWWHRLAHLFHLNGVLPEHYDVIDYDGRHVFIAPKCVTCGHLNRRRGDHSITCPCLHSTHRVSVEGKEG